MMNGAGKNQTDADSTDRVHTRNNIPGQFLSKEIMAVLFSLHFTTRDSLDTFVSIFSGNIS